MREVTLTGAPMATDWVSQALREIENASHEEDPRTTKELARRAISLLKAKDQAIASSTAFSDDGTLLFQMEANKTYLVRLTVLVDEGGGGVKIALNGPAAPAKIRASGTANVTAYDTAIVSTAGGFTWNIIVVNAIVTNGPTPGNLVVRLAQNSSNAAPTTFGKGSRLEYMGV